MELKLEDVQATLIRLQGQIDVWTNLYQALDQEKKKAEEAKNDAAPKA